MLSIRSTALPSGRQNLGRVALFTPTLLKRGVLKVEMLVATMWLRPQRVKADMASDSIVRARIDSDTKDRATEALASMGLSVSDAIRLLLVRVAADGAFPFAVKVPNASTRKAMAELDQGKGKRVRSADALFKDLGI